MRGVLLAPYVVVVQGKDVITHSGKLRGVGIGIYRGKFIVTVRSPYSFTGNARTLILTQIVSPTARC